MAGPTDVIMEDRMVQSSTPGIDLFVRNKHLANMPAPSPGRTLLFIHGATYPAETSFDLPIEGESMMDLFARAGFDVFLVDVRGYGRSTRPPEMDQAPEAGAPVATSEQAGTDLGAAVDYVLALRRIPKLDLMGWSWGTSIAAPTPQNTTRRSSAWFFMRPPGCSSLRPTQSSRRSRPIGWWTRRGPGSAGIGESRRTNGRRSCLRVYSTNGGARP